MGEHDLVIGFLEDDPDQSAWLEQVLVLPRYHHWHHARDPAYADANYAIHLPLVDRLMGTFRLPSDGS